MNWDEYIAPEIANLSPIGVHGLILMVGAIEIIGRVVAALRPRVGAYLVCAWLLGIIITLLILPGYFDIAPRDFGLLLGALALGPFEPGIQLIRLRRLSHKDFK